MISEEKMTHIINLIFKGLEREGFVTYSDQALALREAKKVGIHYINEMKAVADIARNRILSQKNHPPELSSQWATLYQKYYEEELRKKGG